MPEISAVIPTRNRADLLPRVLDALRTQSLATSRFEVIIVDDGSTDNTQEVLKKSEDDLPLRVFRQNRAGIAPQEFLGFSEVEALSFCFLMMMMLPTRICWRSLTLLRTGGIRRLRWRYWDIRI